MALRFLDSFDHYAIADIAEKWSIIDHGGLFTASLPAAQGRRGTSAYRLLHGGTGAPSGLIRGVRQILDAQPTWILGVALKVSAFSTQDNAFFQVIDNGSLQCDLRLRPDGTLRVTRNSVTLGTSTVSLVLGVYAYVEWQITIHNTTGSSIVRVNGIPVLTLSGIDTQETANASANHVALGAHPSGTMTQDMDDFYCCDGTGSAPHNTFLGDCRVDALLPTADGSNSAWTVSAGTQHSLLVDEAVPNDDTDYLSSSTPAARDTHAMGNLTAMPTPTILGVQHCMNAKKGDAGTCAIKNVLKSGATTQAGTTSHALSTSYAYYRELWPTDPNTGAAWTTAAVDAVEAGVEKV